VAHLYDTPTGNETLVAKADWMKLSNAEYLVRAKGFESRNAYSSPGDNDLALFYDSFANDVFEAGHDAQSGIEYARMYTTEADSKNFDNYAEYFERVEAYSSAGGETDYDVATLYDSALTDHVEAAGLIDELHWVQLDCDVTTPSDYVYYVQGFDWADVYSSNDEDTKDIEDEDDIFLWLHLDGWD
jgi:hypothetical protein